MTSRELLLNSFLEKTSWADAEKFPLIGDASFRQYIRLQRRRGDHAILMDAPPPEENVRSFVNVSNLLRSMSFSAPQILAANVDDGFLLLEDFGDDTYTRLLAHGGDEPALYQLATETLIELHQRHENDGQLPSYDDNRLLEESALLVDWFLPAVRGQKTPETLRKQYIELWREVLPLARKIPSTLVLRDFHVDNLMYLPRRTGIRACGLLDFQDAVIGPTSYDLVSLLEDARRDVPKDLASTCLTLYLSAFPGLSAEAFHLSYAVLGAQRSAKVIGVFTRLYQRDRKPLYLKHITRVFRWLEGNLHHPALFALNTWFDREIPDNLRLAPTSTGPL